MSGRFNITQWTVVVDTKSGRPSRDLIGLLNTLLTATTAPNKPTPLLSSTVTLVPDATLYEGNVIYVSNEAGGKVLAFSDGTNWRRVTDRAIIS